MRPPELPPTAGRSAVLRRLEQGHGQFVLVSADEREARRQVIEEIAAAARAQGFEHLSLRAHPLDACAPYGALLPWLTRWATPAPTTAAPSPARGTLSASYSIALAGLMLPPTSSVEGRPTSAPPPREVERETGTQTPLRSLSPEEVRAELLELVEGRARQRAAVVSILDAHHLDPSSQQWFEFLGRRLEGLPLLVVLGLDPFSEPFELWKSSLEGAPMVLDRGPPASARSPALPPLSDRLRPLPARSLDVLLAAALAGPDATPDLVREVLGWGEQELPVATSPAVDQRLLLVGRDTLEVLEPDLYPDLAGTASKARVTSMHRSLARALEKRQPHAHGPALFRVSEHWAESGEVGAGVASLTAASLEAERWGAPEIAERRLRRALALAQSEPTARGRELEEKAFAQLATTRGRNGDAKGSADAFLRAWHLAEERGAKPLQFARYVCGWADATTRLAGDPEDRLRSTLELVRGRSNDLEALLLRSLSFYYVERGRSDLAVDAAERACALAERGSDAVLKVRTHQVAMNAYIFRGDSPELARTHAEKALTYRPQLEGTPDVGIMVILMDGLANVVCGLGDEPEALRRGEEALQAARKYGYRNALLLVLGNLAEHHTEAGDYRRAQELCEELRRTCDRLGISEKEPARLQANLLEGLIASGEGRYDEAQRTFDHLLTAAEAGGGRYFIGQTLVHLTVLAAKRGDAEAARKYLRRLEREGVRKTLVGQNRRVLEAAEAKVRGKAPAAGR